MPKSKAHSSMSTTNEMRVLIDRISKWQRTDRQIMDDASTSANIGTVEQCGNAPAEVNGDGIVVENDGQNGGNDRSVNDENQQQLKKLQQICCWNSNACHQNIKIIGANCLTIHYKAKGQGSSSVFSNFAIPCSSSDSSDNFYFEIFVVKSAKNSVSIGLATKAMPLSGIIGHHLDTYAYQNNGIFWINGTKKIGNSHTKFGAGDIVGCGFSPVTRRVFFTKNGVRFDTADLFISPTFTPLLFPCISLHNSGDKIEAKFVPEFKFGPANVKMLSTAKQPQNNWDGTRCHVNLTVSRPNSLTVHYKENKTYGYRSVFAKCSILNTSSICGAIFYYEILVENCVCRAIIGIAVKQHAPLDDAIRFSNGTYAYESDGWLWSNGSSKSGNERFGSGDVVGCGVNLVTGKLFFTKNGRRIGPFDLSVCSSPPMGQLFPFVSLHFFGDKIEANFGPEFMFNLATLSR